MNGLGINKASKNDKDTNILTPEEVALLRAHASDGTLTAEERETYSKHLEAMKKLMPDESKVDKSMPDESEVDVLGLRVARAFITVALVMLVLPFVISAFQFWMYMHPSLP